MKRKILFMVFIFALLFFVTMPTFAVNNISNSFSENAGKLGNDVEEAAGATGRTIENTINSMKNSITNGTKNAQNMVSNEVTEMTNDLDGDYTAQRTVASEITDTDIMNTNLWTWVALAIAGIIIVGLVWYYASERDVNR